MEASCLHATLIGVWVRVSSAVSTNEHLIFSVWQQTKTYSDLYPTFLLLFSKARISLELTPHASHTGAGSGERAAGDWRPLSVECTPTGRSLPSRTFVSALCLPVLPCYQPSQPDQSVIYVWRRLFLMLGGDMCQWLPLEILHQILHLTYAEPWTGDRDGSISRVGL